MKNYLVIGRDCRIEYLSKTVEGTVADIKLAKLCSLSFPVGSCILQDCGFQGLTAGEDVEILQPSKKGRNKKRTPFEKLVNQIISSSRVFIEHVIGSSKRWRAVHDICRLRGEGIQDLLMEICCGLHNLKVRILPWKPVPEPGIRIKSV
jgi:hypothetical protein